MIKFILLLILFQFSNVKSNVTKVEYQHPINTSIL